MLLEIHPYNPQQRHIDKVVDILHQDGVIIYPTDTAYAFGCSIYSKKAMKRIYQLKQIDQKQPLTFICYNTSQFQAYTKGIPNSIFKRIKPHLPGPYTFIFEASKLVPKTMLSKRKTIGVKLPDAPIPLMIAQLLNTPLLSTSVPWNDEDAMNFQDPHEIYNTYKNRIDCMLNSGDIYETQSAVIDFTNPIPEIVRRGSANLDWLI